MKLKKSVGIDIGTSRIKLIELEDKKGRLALTKCAVEPVAEGDVKSALTEILNAAKLSSKRVNIALSGPSVIVRYLELPPMKKNELQSAIKFEGEKYIPFDIKESVIDCMVLDKVSSGSQRVLLVAAKKAEVNKQIELFKGLGLEVNAIDVDSFAFLNSFQRAGIINGKAESTYALMNMGARFSNMNIVTNGNVYFTRDILWGGSDISKRIKDTMGIGQEDAEKLKCSPPDKKEELAKIIAPFLEKLSSQVSMSFDYFESQFGKAVQKIFISGGSSYLLNAAESLKDNLGMDVSRWNPFDNISLKDPVKEIEAAPARFAVAVGLALRK